MLKRKSGKLNFKGINFINFLRKSIRAKLLLAFLLSTVFIVSLGAYSYKLAADELQASAELNSQQTLKSGGEYLKLMSGVVEAISAQILLNEDVQKLYLNPRQNLKSSDAREAALNIGNYLDSLVLANQNLISCIGIIGTNDLNFSNNSSAQYVKVRNLGGVEDMLVYKEALKGDRKPVWIGDTNQLSGLYNQSKAGTGLSCVRVLKENASGKVGGILVIELKQEPVKAVLDTINPGLGSEAHFIGTDGFDLGFSSNEKTMAPANGGYEFSKGKIYGQIKNDSAANSYSSIRYNHKKYLLVYCKPEGTDFILATLLPFSILLSGAARILMTTLILTSFAAVCSIAVAVKMSGGMSATINNIVYTAQKAASGDLTYKPETGRIDELGVLTLNMSSMMDNMRTVIEETAATAEQVSVATQAVASSTNGAIRISEGICTAVEEIAKGAAEQANDAENGAGKANELALKIDKVSSKTISIKNVSDQTMDFTKSGLLMMDELNTRVQQTNSIIKDIIYDVQELGKRSKMIESIVKAITGISDQTNLLAFNAAIEAARSGAAGKGFAVVADEIKKLADQSKQSAHEIAGIVSKTQEQTIKTVEKAKSSGGILESQNKALERVVQSFDGISSSMGALILKVKEISEDVCEMEVCKDDVITSIQNISAVSQQTAATTEEVAASTEMQLKEMEQLMSKAGELQKNASELKVSVSKFIIKA